MGYQTQKVFGRRETVHIVSPDFLSLPKMEVALPAGTKIKAGEFIGIDGNKITLGTEKKMSLLVTEDTHYGDMLTRAKPSNMMEGFFGEFLMHTKVFKEGDTAFVAGDNVSLDEGVICHTDDNHTISVGQVVGRGADWIAVAIGA